MLIKLLRIGLRFVAWFSAFGIFLVLFAMLLLANIHAIAPSLAKHAVASQGGELSVEDVDIEWVDQFTVLSIRNLVLRRNTVQENSELSVDQIIVRLAQPSSERINWEVANIDIVNPNLVSHRTSLSQPSPRQHQFDTNYDDSFSSGFAFLSNLQNIKVTGGEYDLKLDAGLSPIEVSGDFSIQGQTLENSSYTSFQLTSNEFADMLVSVNVSNTQHDDGPALTDMELVVDSTRVSSLAPMFANVPRIAAIDLMQLETKLDARVNAHWTGSELDSFNFSVSANDPNFDGAIANVKESRLSVNGSLALEGGIPQRVNAEFELESLDFAAILELLPGAFPPKFYKHVSERLGSLWLTKLKGTFSADPRTLANPDSDWTLNAEGEFENYRYQFGSKWPPLENGSGTYTVDGKKLTINGSQGSIYGYPIQHAVATIEDGLVADPVMTVTTRIELPFIVANDFFGKEGIVSPGKLNWIAEGQGTAGIDLTVDVPLRRGKEFVVAGSIKFNDAALLTTHGINAENVSGDMVFDRYGITSGKISGQMLGGPFATVFSGSGTTGNFTTDGKASGQAKADQLDAFLKGPITDNLSGELNWDADYRFTSKDDEMSITASLVDVISTLPFPMQKNAGIEMPLNVTMRTEERSKRTIDLNLGLQVEASLQASFEDENWRVRSGTVSVGDALPTMSEETGIKVLINLPLLDYGAWSDLLKGSEHKGDFQLSRALKSVVVKAHELKLPGQYELQNADITAEKTESHWDVALSSDTVKGKALYRNTEFISEGEVPTLDIDLSVCHLSADKRKNLKKNPTDPANLPAISFRCEDTKYGQYRLGESTIDAEPGEKSWEIKRAEFNRPHFNIQASGEWFYDQTSKIDFLLETDDFGRTIEDLGYPRRINKGIARISGGLWWDAALTRWDTRHVSGHIEIDSSTGAIVSSTNPDALRLVGVLNYDTILQKFSHDVTDVLGEEGILYEQLKGTAKLNNGVFEVEGIYAEGPTMSMAITGTSNWNTKQHQLTLGVEPQINNSLTTLATLFINPVTGALVYVGGKLAEEMDIIYSHRYDITGSWDEPSIERVARPAASNQSNNATGNR